VKCFRSPVNEENDVEVKANQCQFHVVLGIVLLAASLSSEIQKEIILRLGDQIAKDHQPAYSLGAAAPGFPDMFSKQKRRKHAKRAFFISPSILLIASLMYRRALSYSLRA
jgi:hypothetical protein